jgi:hypothetical protein
MSHGFGIYIWNGFSGLKDFGGVLAIDKILGKTRGRRFVIRFLPRWSFSVAWQVPQGLRPGVRRGRSGPG